jgi:hypothetical protein
MMLPGAGSASNQIHVSMVNAGTTKSADGATVPFVEGHVLRRCMVRVRRAIERVVVEAIARDEVDLAARVVGQRARLADTARIGGVVRIVGAAIEPERVERDATASREPEYEHHPPHASIVSRVRAD